MQNKIHDYGTISPWCGANLMNGYPHNLSICFHHLQASNWSTVISILLPVKALIGHNPGRFLASKVQLKDHLLLLSMVIVPYIAMLGFIANQRWEKVKLAPSSILKLDQLLLTQAPLT